MGIIEDIMAEPDVMVRQAKISSLAGAMFKDLLPEAAFVITTITDHHRVGLSGSTSDKGEMHKILQRACLTLEEHKEQGGKTFDFDDAREAANHLARLRAQEADE